jgi:hypothetical protein
MCALFPRVAIAGTPPNAQTLFLETVDRMMVALAPHSARASATIRDAYRGHLDLLVLDEYSALTDALATGGLVPLPADPQRFNLAPRLAGPFPIGEKDLANQVSYISARPAMIGALLEIASRVTSGPLEITSLVRHTEYQGALKTTNINAHTSVPMHTMGLAIDIALVNTPLQTVYEIRNVLRQMQDAGDILFIGERKQLVFHVVPHPSRLGHFTEVYVKALASRETEVLPSVSVQSVADAALVPAVSAEVIAVLPTPDYAAEWWAADDLHSDLTVGVSAHHPQTPRLSALSATTSSAGRLAGIFLSLVGGLLQATWGMIT